MNNSTQILSGTIHTGNNVSSTEILDRVNHAAHAYFGNVPIVTTIYITEIRSIGNQILGYEIDYTAEPKI